jgi:hypothetical protein
MRPAREYLNHACSAATTADTAGLQPSLFYRQATCEPLLTGVIACVVFGLYGASTVQWHMSVQVMCATVSGLP